MSTNVYNIYVGAETGLLKGVDAQSSNWSNLTSLEHADRQKEIVCMCWNNDVENEICLARRDQTVSVHSTSTGDVVRTLNLNGGTGTFGGLSRFDSNYVTCTESGLLRVWTASGEPKVDVSAGEGVSCMRCNEQSRNLVATGGKENELKIWNVERLQTPVFTAKNVRNDWLNLRVPVWVRDAAFLPDSQCVVTCTNYHQVRVYDPATSNRRPVLDLKFNEEPLTCLALRHSVPRQVIVGNSHGSMALIDLRGKGQVVQQYKGAEGGLRAVACDKTQDVVVSCGLDRYLRVHDINSKQLLQKIYMKSRLNCLLISNKRLSADETLPGDTEVDDDVWEKMETVSTAVTGPKSRKRKATSGKTVVMKKTT